MNVLETYSIGAANKQFTTLLLDGEMPRGKFTHVKQGLDRYELVWMSGGRLSEVSICGVHDELKGKEIEFE